MSRRFKFFEKILTQLNEIQTALNTLRATIKEEIQNDAHTTAGENRDRARG